MPIGPTLPPSTEKRKREDESDSSDRDDMGPHPPSPPQPKSSPKRLRVVGPALPLGAQSKEEPSQKKQPPTADSDSSSDDDDFGPALPDKYTTSPNTNSHPSSAAQKPVVPAPEPKTKRDEWMTLAPTSNDWSQRVDPTKLKSRKFNTGRGPVTPSSTAGGGGSGGDAWYETPEQKQARLQREVLGIKDSKTTRPKAEPTASKPSRDDAETTRRMKEYSKMRGPSLYEAHQVGKKEEDDDPSARAFDREKDIGGGLQINATQRREMMSKNKDFGSRFSSARYL